MRNFDKAMAHIDEVIDRGSFKPNWGSLSTVTFPRWYVNGKFGVFIHWGPSSVPAYMSDWYSRAMYDEESEVYEHHVKTYGPQSTHGYKDFIPNFTMEHYDPMEWASLFRRAGAQFVMPIAEYHDGFAEYDSAFTEYSAVNMGPKLDLLGSLGSALDKAGIVLGASSHYAENWWFYNGGIKFDSDVQDLQYSELYGPAQRQETAPNDMWMQNWLARTYDFVEKYRPQLVWFDAWISAPSFQPYIKKFLAYYYNRGMEWGLEVAVNYKHDAMLPEAAVYDVERGQLSDIREPFWQTDTSMSRNSWIYINDHDYKPVELLIGDLVDIVSKNGALLLNIGPRSDGTIAEEERETLEGIGRFLEVNGEAIYSTRPWKIFGEGPTKVQEGEFTDTFREPYNSEDIRFTVRPAQFEHDELLYATMLAWPDSSQVTIRSLGTSHDLYVGEISQVHLLGVPTELDWKRTSEGLIIQMPQSRPTPHALSFRITPVSNITDRILHGPTHGPGPSYSV